MHGDDSMHMSCHMYIFTFWFWTLSSFKWITGDKPSKKILYCETYISNKLWLYYMFIRNSCFHCIDREITCWKELKILLVLYPNLKITPMSGNYLNASVRFSTSTKVYGQRSGMSWPRKDLLVGIIKSRFFLVNVLWFKAFPTWR